MIIVIMPATGIDWSKEEPSFKIIFFGVSVRKKAIQIGMATNKKQDLF